MQLTCPNCGARYRIDATDWPTDPGPEGELLPEPLFRPRRARCKVCRTVWSATPEEEVLELDDPLPPDEEHPRLADAAWGAVAGWPDPKPLSPPPAPQPDFAPSLERPPAVFQPPVFTPPKDPSAPLYAPPKRPAIHFEAPPVPMPMPGRPAIRTRLPGPGAASAADEPELAVPPVPVRSEPGPVRAEPVPVRAEPGPVRAEPEIAAGEPEPPEADSWDEDESYLDQPARPWWRWPGALLLLAVAVWAFLVATGRVQPEAYGLPPYNPAAIGLPEVSMPGMSLETVRLPRAAPPPLKVAAEVVRRKLPGDREVWEIAGTIRNPTSRSQPVPPVEIVLLDGKGAEAGRWTVRPEARAVAPGAAVRFETSAIDPPARAVKLRMQLKPAELGRL